MAWMGEPPDLVAPQVQLMHQQWQIIEANQRVVACTQAPCPMNLVQKVVGNRRQLCVVEASCTNRASDWLQILQHTGIQSLTCSKVSNPQHEMKRDSDVMPFVASGDGALHMMQHTVAGNRLQEPQQNPKIGSPGNSIMRSEVSGSCSTDS